MINLDDPTYVSSLWDAMKRSNEEMKPFRENRRTLLDTYIGTNWRGTGYARQGERQRKPRETMVNLMAMTVSTYVTSLVAENPRVTAYAADSSLRAFSGHFSAAINHLVRELNFNMTEQLVVMDAIFGIGITKTSRIPATPVPMANPEWTYAAGQIRQMEATVLVDPGKPGVQRVSQDDFGFDMTAKAWDRARYAWDEYDVPLSDLLSDDRINPELLQDVTGSDRPVTSIFDSAGFESEDECRFVEPMVRVADFYLPFEQRFGMFMQGGVLLFHEEWDGPASGPYDLLRIDDVPDHIVPKSPAQDLWALHELYNSLFRKSANQTMKQKRVHTFRSAADAEKIKTAPDDGFIQVSDTEGLKTLALNGPDQAVLAFGQITEGVHSRAAGNLDGMAGLGPQAKTAAQEGFLQAALSRREERMRSRVMGHVQAVMTKLGHMLWYDQFATIQAEMELPMLERAVPVLWTPEDREGDFYQYQIRVEPYSMMLKSPNARAEQIVNLLNVIMPLTPLAAQQGIMLDLPGLIDQLAELYDEPRLRHIFQMNFSMIGVPGSPADPMSSGSGMMPKSNAPHHYVRHNVSTGGSPQSNRTTAIQSLLSSPDVTQGGNVA